VSYSVVIPSRNPDNVEACFRSIRAAGETCRVIVVDDGLGRWPPGPEYVMGVNPFVFARNANRGIAAAGMDDVILMNDDARLSTPHGFRELCFYSYGKGVVSAAVTGATVNRNQVAQGKGLRPEPRVLAFICVYLPRPTLSVVGGLDERFVDYGWDDNDYCRRVLDAGLDLAIYDGCVVEHGVAPHTFTRDCKPNGRRYAEKYAGRLLPEEARFLKGIGA